MRIVSLLPAATEIVWALGLADDLVGVSHACDHPAGVVGRPIVTGPPAGRTGAPEPVEMHPRRAGDAAARPRPRRFAPRPRLGAPRARRDRALRTAIDPDATVVVLEPASIEGIFHAIATVGAMTDAEDEAVGLVEILRERLADVEEVVEERREQGHHSPRVVALEWLEPPVAGRALGSRAGPPSRRLGGPRRRRRAGPHRQRGTRSRTSIPEMLLLVPRGMHLAEAVRAWRAFPRPRGW